MCYSSVPCSAEGAAVATEAGGLSPQPEGGRGPAAAVQWAGASAPTSPGYSFAALIYDPLRVPGMEL